MDGRIFTIYSHKPEPFKVDPSQFRNVAPGLQDNVNKNC